MLNADRACGNAPLKSSRDPNSPDPVLYITYEVAVVMNVSSAYRTQPVVMGIKGSLAFIDPVYSLPNQTCFYREFALVRCHMGTTPQACSTGGLERCDGRLHTLRDECGVFRLVLLQRDTQNQK
ncbi:hypothetical protein MHYP_G00074120 [Metynnis hypsauchen]